LGNFRELLESIATRKNFNLENEYRILNTQLFGGELPNVKIRWFSGKQVGGKVISTRKNSSERFKSSIIKISDFIQSSREELLGVLVHEMIHVYLIDVMGNYKDSHGTDFMNQLNRINKMKLGFIVPKTEDITYRKVTKKDEKELNVVFFKKKGSEDVSILVFSNKVTPILINEWISKFPKDWHKNFDFEIYTTTEPEIKKYPIKRKIGKFVAYEINDLEAITNIRANGTRF